MGIEPGGQPGAGRLYSVGSRTVEEGKQDNNERQGYGNKRGVAATTAMGDN